jgi:Protein of unknown function (DUF4038)/Putative collagen-binding domain of a collagenase
MKLANVSYSRQITLASLMVFALLLLGCKSRTNSNVPPNSAATAQTPAYPLRVSANHRYLIGQNEIPFLIVGDSPQGLMARLTEEEADRYFANRQSHGFNTLGWIDVLCAGRDFPDNTNAATVDGIRPFLGYLPGGTDYTHYDLGKPNEAYFARLDHIVALAAKHGLFAFLAPAETNGWIPTLHNNGLGAAYAYGQYLGNRYKGFSNVAWLSGNDFVTWKDPKDDAVVQAVAKGIRSVDPNHLQTVELNYETSSSFDDPTWVPLISLNGTYTYSPTYMQMFHSYNQTPVAPVYLVEAHYDQENVGHPPDYGTPPTLRREEYWTMLSGGSGQFYGNFYTWSFSPGWKYYIDTAGVAQLTIWKDFFASLPWYEFIPDQDHSTVTAGLGTYGTFKTPVSKSDFCTGAKTADGSFVVAYLPTVRTITVNMAALKGPANAKWFDPASGIYTSIAAEPVANSGTHQFTPPQHNSDGDTDWVLLLDASGTSVPSKGIAK